MEAAAKTMISPSPTYSVSIGASSFGASSVGAASVTCASSAASEPSGASVAAGSCATGSADAVAGVVSPHAPKTDTQAAEAIITVTLFHKFSFLIF